LVSPDSQIVTGVDFVAVPTNDLDAAVEFYGTTLGLERSVYYPERHFAEFETGTVTLSVIVADKFGLDYQPNHNAPSAASSSPATPSTPGCVTWRSFPTQTATR
jgi:catechol 2,3-dioxygenase-like lactoylglutathione lyase family enzyme